MSSKVSFIFTSVPRFPSNLHQFQGFLDHIYISCKVSFTFTSVPRFPWTFLHPFQGFLHIYISSKVCLNIFRSVSRFPWSYLHQLQGFLHIDISSKVSFRSSRVQGYPQRVYMSSMIILRVNKSFKIILRVYTSSMVTYVWNSRSLGFTWVPRFPRFLLSRLNWVLGFFYIGILTTVSRFYIC